MPDMDDDAITAALTWKEVSASTDDDIYLRYASVCARLNAMRDNRNQLRKAVETLFAQRDRLRAQLKTALADIDDWKRRWNEVSSNSPDTYAALHAYIRGNRG